MKYIVTLGFDYLIFQKILSPKEYVAVKFLYTLVQPSGQPSGQPQVNHQDNQVVNHQDNHQDNQVVNHLDNKNQIHSSYHKIRTRSIVVTIRTRSIVVTKGILSSYPAYTVPV